LTGEAGVTDPACNLSPKHATILEMASAEAAGATPPFTYRRMRPGVATERGARRAVPERVTPESVTIESAE
jgi:pyrroloquinoline quinone biosynthesis protein E